MSTSEQDRVERIQRDFKAARRVGKRLGFNTRTGKIQVVGNHDPDDPIVEVAQQNLGYSA